MTMVDPVQVSPVPWVVLREFLLSRTEITSRVGTQVLPRMPATFPGIRLIEITVKKGRPWSRAYMQFDCWADDQRSADDLAGALADLLLALHQYVTDSVVLVSDVDWHAAQMPDTSVTLAGGQPQPRSILTGHVWLRPNT